MSSTVPSSSTARHSYFDRPGHFEFRVGDHQHEFGVIDTSYAPPGQTQGPAGEIVFWHVDDVEATLAKLVSAGATEYAAQVAVVGR
jgi:hypothetical protein